jgi:hypothetical protein
MLMPSIVALAIVVALFRGGSLRHFGKLHLRWIPLVGASLVLQLLLFTPFSKTSLVAFAVPELYMASMLLLVAWVALNWRIPGMALLAAGLLCNTIAIAVNGGHMPVSPESATYAGRIANYATEGLAVDNNSIATNSNVHLWILTDILALPRWFPLANVFSIGDVLIVVGACLLCYRTMLGKLPAAPVTPRRAHEDPAVRSVENAKEHV